jgi:hypothetical protein
MASTSGMKNALNTGTMTKRERVEGKVGGVPGKDGTPEAPSDEAVIVRSVQVLVEWDEPVSITKGDAPRNAIRRITRLA